jgi:hypothetical protein
MRKATALIPARRVPKRLAGKIKNIIMEIESW